MFMRDMAQGLCVVLRGFCVILRVFCVDSAWFCVVLRVFTALGIFRVYTVQLENEQSMENAFVHSFLNEKMCLFVSLVPDVSLV